MIFLFVSYSYLERQSRLCYHAQHMDTTVVVYQCSLDPTLLRPLGWDETLLKHNPVVEIQTVPDRCLAHDQPNFEYHDSRRVVVEVNASQTDEDGTYNHMWVMKYMDRAVKVARPLLNEAQPLRER